MHINQSGYLWISHENNVLKINFIKLFWNNFIIKTMWYFRLEQFMLLYIIFYMRNKDNNVRINIKNVCNKMFYNFGNFCIKL